MRFLSVVGGGRGNLAENRGAALKHIIKGNWVLPPYDSAPGALVAEVFRANDFSPPKPLVKTISIQLTVSLIASGEFVGILPTSVARLSAHQAPLRILPLKSAGPRISAEIVFLKNRTLSPPVESFIKCVREIAISLGRYLDQPNGRLWPQSGHSRNTDVC